MSHRFLWIDALVSFAVAIVPVSTTNVDTLVDHDIMRTFMGCVSGKLRDNQDFAITLGSVTIDILSPTTMA
ncbi:hypothetical protein KA037_03805 [Patescibacteria group bacterium]|nr:hypothetical protein [Patescibacteria group bacterium]